MSRLKKARILFQMTGSIACYKAAGAISRLVQVGHEVQVVASASALRFIGAATLEGLTGKKVLSDAFEPGHAMDHIYLARWADVLVLCPATAHSVNRLKQGLADDLIGSLFLAHTFDKPYLIFPAMNTRMLQHPATQLTLQTLQEWGVIVAKTQEGSLACGEEGEGRLLEAEEIASLVEKASLSTQFPKGHILITSGGTQEPIDGVRAMTNKSSGRTGFELVNSLSRRGWSVIHLQSASAEVRSLPSLAIETHQFSDFMNLEKQLKMILGKNKFFAVIHLAAVSDYSVRYIGVGGKKFSVDKEIKLDSEEEISLHLAKNIKLLSHVKAWGDVEHLIGFKLTQGADNKEQKQAIAKLFASAPVDLVVYNDLSEKREGEVLPRQLFEYQGLWRQCTNNQELAAYLDDWLNQKLESTRGKDFLLAQSIKQEGPTL